MFGTTVEDRLRGTAADIQRRGAETGQAVIASTRNAAGQASDGGSRALSQVVAAIEDYPLAALGVAFGVGLVLGLLRRPRRTR